MKYLLILIAFLTLLLSFCSYTINQSQDRVRAVDEFVINSALEVREYIIENGRCPIMLKGWGKANDNGDYQLEIRHGTMSTFFKCDGDLSYNYIVKYSMDSGIYLSGKNDSDIELTYGHFTDHKKLNICENSEIKDIVDIIRNY